MSHKIWLLLIPLVIFGFFAVLPQPVAADSQLQVVYQTPTAQPDGRVLYKVQEGDSCMRIELLTGVKAATLRELNKLDQSCTLIAGKELLLAVVTPEPTPTPNPNMTATPPLPTPTAMRGTGKICVTLYNDVNGNAVHEDSELVMAGGAVSVSDRLGVVSQTGNTGTDEQLCFNEVPEGEYNISMGVPGGYNGTTLLTQILKVQAGETAVLEFGAQPSSQTGGEQAATEEEKQQGGDNNLMIAILGGILVVGGIGLGAYIVFSRGK